MTTRAANPPTFSRQLFAFNSSLQSIDSLELLLDELKEKFALPDDKFRSMWVVLNEAMSNAILHGNKCDPYKKILMWVETSKGKSITFRVKDEGRGFDPARVPDPTSPERIMKPNGRGVFLIRQLADAVTYSCNGTVVEIGFEIAG